MGDPPKLRNKCERPKRLWAKERVVRDKQLKGEYQLKSMKELWMADGTLRKFRREARRLLSLGEEEQRADAVKLLSSLVRNGILRQGATLEDVLGLDVKKVLERRLQTFVFRKGLARSMKQARQLITHGFISINGRKITVPSYFVPLGEEGSIAYARLIELGTGTMAKDNNENNEPKERRKKEEKQGVAAA